MASYVVPQVEIHQLFSEAPASLTTTQVPFVFGPNYQLHRFDVSSEKEKTYAGEYNSESDGTTDREFEYPEALDPEKVDKSYTKLYGDNVVLKLFELERSLIKPVYAYDDAGTSSSSDDTSTFVPNKIDLLVTADQLSEVITGRHLVIDANPASASVDYNDVIITGTEVVETPDPFATSSDSSYDLYTIRVEIDEELDESIFSTSATKRIEKILVCEERDGVEFPRELPTDSAKTTFEWTETTNSQSVPIIKITSDLVAKIKDTDYEFSTTEYPDYPGYAKVLFANLYITFRELLTSSADTIHSIVNASEVADALGTVHPDNPLAQAVYNTALNAGGQTVRYMAVDTTDLSVYGDDSDALKEGYNTVLEAATKTKEVYFFVPVTRDSAILDLVQAHVDSLSAATVKHWRIAFVSAEIPDNDTIYSSANNTSNRDFYARPTKFSKVDDDTFVDVEFVVKNGNTWSYDPDTRFTKDLSVGDVLVTDFENVEWGRTVPREYTIKAIVNKYTVRVYETTTESELSTHTLLKPAWVSTKAYTEGQQVSYTYTESGKTYNKLYQCIDDVPASTSGNDAPNVATTKWSTSLTGVKAEIYHPYTNAEKATVIKNLSSAFADRRVYNVFPSYFTTDGVTMSGEYAAACVAGLVSSCLPQQPVTNVELKGIDDVPMTYQTFTADQLNTMASGGTFIVMQDLPNDEVYVRHQISTDYESNNLNTAELSITKNLDSISFFFDDLLSPYIGKYNITPELIETLRAQITKGIVSLSADSYGLYGPQLIFEGTEILLLEQDALLKDHVNCNLQLNMPYPFNHLVLKLFV